MRCSSDITGTVTKLMSGAEMVMPGDNTTLAVELLEPVAMQKGGRCVWDVLVSWLLSVME